MKEQKNPIVLSTLMSIPTVNWLSLFRNIYDEMWRGRGEGDAGTGEVLEAMLHQQIDGQQRPSLSTELNYRVSYAITKKK